MFYVSPQLATGGQGEEFSGPRGTGRRGLRAATIAVGCIVAAASFSETPGWQRLPSGSFPGGTTQEPTLTPTALRIKYGEEFVKKITKSHIARFFDDFRLLPPRYAAKTRLQCADADTGSP